VTVVDQRRPVTAKAARLAWLDALRGFAALTVVGFHLSPLVIGTDRHLAIMRQIDFGKCGVLLFFLVSGYVVPMSLERHGDLRRFWIGRLFRIYPAYLAAIAVVALLAAGGLISWQASLRADPVTGLLAHATMMPDLVGLRGAVRVFWTLSYEMTFYLIVAGLYAWRLHRHSGWWAGGIALTALLAAPVLPDGLLGSTRALAAVLMVVMVLIVSAHLSDRFVLWAGAAGIAFVLLPAVNGHATRNSTVIASWQGLLLIAVMFAGTVVFRCQHGQLGRGPAALALTVVALSVIVAHQIETGTGLLWVANVGAVAGTFAVAYALRNRAVPGFLSRLGQISYSLYLLHAVVLLLLMRAVPDFAALPGPLRVALGLGYLAVVLGLAWISYRVVEVPAQALGRRLGSPKRRSPFTSITPIVNQEPEQFRQP
jgi:peptidoglycan/LPS O-acetylase OafA/YrhL